jgi:very-short-patch-repair endonuclease
VAFAARPKDARLAIPKQEPIERYIVDFICFEARLIIEVDGGQHFQSETDKKRDAFLRLRGFRMLRLWNNEVLSNLEGVYQTIVKTLHECAPRGAHSPSSSFG